MRFYFIYYWSKSSSSPMLDDSNISAECYMRHNGMTQKLLTETPRHQIHSGKQKCHIQSKNIHNIILSQK